MNFEDLVCYILQRQENGTIPKYLIDKNHLQETLESLNQDMDNITIPEAMIDNMLCELIPLGEYALYYERSYQSVINNLGQYKSLVSTFKNKRNRYVIAKYELYHGKRLENFGHLLEYYIIQNKEIGDAVLNDALKHNKQVASVLLDIIKSHYKK